MVSYTYSSHGAQIFPDSLFHYAYFPKWTFTWQTMFLLSLAALVITLGEVSGSKWPAVKFSLIARQQVLPWKEEAWLNTLVS